MDLRARSTRLHSAYVKTGASCQHTTLSRQSMRGSNQRGRTEAEFHKKDSEFMQSSTPYSSGSKSWSMYTIRRTPRRGHCPCPAAGLLVACSRDDARRTTSNRNARPSATAACRCDAVASAALALSSRMPRSMSASCAARNGRRQSP